MTVHSARYKRRRIGCFILLLLLVFSLAFAVSVGKFVRQRRAPLPPTPLPPAPPTFVVTPTNLTLWRTLHADVRADYVITLSANVDGEILRLCVDIGSIVTQGQTLIELDPRYKLIALQDAQAHYDQALATASNAFIDWQNSAQLLTNAVIGDERYRQAWLAYQIADANQRSAAAALARAREQLRDCIIRAPRDAAVSARMVEPHERVSPLQPLLTLVDDLTLRIVFFVEDRDVIHLRTNMPIYVTVDSLPDTEFTAAISAIGAAAEPSTLLYRVEATFDNSARQLKPGMVARVRVPVRQLTNALLVPVAAVKFDDLGPHVTCINQGTYSRVPVLTGQEYEGWVQILSGLAPGDTVLLQ